MITNFVLKIKSNLLQFTKPIKSLTAEYNKRIIKITHLSINDKKQKNTITKNKS